MCQPVLQIFRTNNEKCPDSVSHPGIFQLTSAVSSRVQAPSRFQEEISWAWFSEST